MQENSTQNSNILIERLKVALKVKTDTDLAKMLNITKSTLSGWRNRGSFNYDMVFAKYEHINPSYILYGDNPIYRDHEMNQIKESSIVREPVPMYSDNRNKIPLVDNGAAAGFGTESFSITESNVLDYYVVPDFQNIQFMIRVRGSSMEPKYNSGDVVACRILHDPSFIQWNKVHLIATRDQGILIKRLCRSDKPDHYLCVSENKDYDPFDIPVGDITGIALVVGGICID